MFTSIDYYFDLWVIVDGETEDFGTAGGASTINKGSATTDWIALLLIPIFLCLIGGYFTRRKKKEMDDKVFLIFLILKKEECCRLDMSSVDFILSTYF